MTKYRCGRDKCRRIYHLSKPPGDDKRCACGGKLHDYSADRRRNKARNCTCNGYPFMHKRGSRFCLHNPNRPPFTYDPAGSHEAQFYDAFGRLPNWTDEEPFDTLDYWVREAERRGL